MKGGLCLRKEFPGGVDGGRKKEVREGGDLGKKVGTSLFGGPLRRGVRRNWEGMRFGICRRGSKMWSKKREQRHVHCDGPRVKVCALGGGL